MPLPLLAVVLGCRSTPALRECWLPSLTMTTPASALPP
jgi:hypothetical protein